MVYCTVRNGVRGAYKIPTETGMRKCIYRYPPQVYTHLISIYLYIYIKVIHIYLYIYIKFSKQMHFWLLGRGRFKLCRDTKRLLCSKLLGHRKEVHHSFIVLGVESWQGACAWTLGLRNFNSDVHDVVEVVVVILQRARNLVPVSPVDDTVAVQTAS